MLYIYVAFDFHNKEEDKDITDYIVVLQVNTALFMDGLGPLIDL